MTLYAYRAIADINTDVDMSSSTFVSALESMREDARTRVRQLGGDPLEREQVILRANKEAHTVRMMWRSNIMHPEDSHLVENVRALVQQADTVVAWRLDYHRCGNGVRQPCEPWQTLVEEEI